MEDKYSEPCQHMIEYARYVEESPVSYDYGCGCCGSQDVDCAICKITSTQYMIRNAMK